MRALILLFILIFGCTSAPIEGDPVIEEVVTKPSNPEPICSGPVCGSNGQSYDTDCDAIDAKVDFVIGECKPIILASQCVESDGGLHADVYGSVILGNFTYEDKCINSSNLLEFTCIENEIKNSTVICDGMCFEGECIELLPELDNNCYGPTKPNLENQNTVTLRGVNYSSTCVDYSTVKTFYCKDNNISAININCDPGYRCDQGMCIPLENGCNETDNGKDIYQKGRTNAFRGLANLLNEWDECDDEGTIIEYYCEEGLWKKEYLSCGSGYKCSNGRCVEGLCDESDQGIDIYKKGKVTIDDNEYTDSCISDYKLREYYCYGDDYESDDIQCPKDHICDGARCVEGSID